MSRRNIGKQAAAALKYNPDLNYAPVVVASGLGELAKKIINIADESINGCQTFITGSKATVKINANPKEIKNLKFAALVLDSRIGKNSNTYPIKAPIQAVGTQKTVSVYTAQVNNSKQIENRLVTVNASNFFDLKNDVNVGIKEYAHSREENTTKNQESV